MTLRAKHDFKLQTKVGEFVHFRAGQLIPHGYENHVYVREHSEPAIVAPKVTVTREMKEMPQKSVEPTSKLSPEQKIHQFPPPTNPPAGIHKAAPEPKGKRK